MKTYHKDRKWVIVRIDGKIASVSTDYRQLASISGQLARKNGPEVRYTEITAVTVSFEEVWKIRQEICWEDLILFGTDFQKKVWQRLWELPARELISYSDFAELCQNRAGVRAVAHALGLNPVSVIIPCHLVVPKETIDKIAEIQKRAESTIFKGDDLSLKSILSDSASDFGEYSLGRDLKRDLILKEFENYG